MNVLWRRLVARRTCCRRAALNVKAASQSYSGNIKNETSVSSVFELINDLIVF